MDKQHKAASQFDVKAYPTTFILNRKGEVTAQLTGFFEWNSDDVKTYLDELASQ